jgi:nucleotide-binding universal stress UspA family protein
MVWSRRPGDEFVQLVTRDRDSLEVTGSVDFAVWEGSESFDRDCRDAAQREIGKWSDKVNAAGVPVESTVTPSPPVEAIERLAGEIDADLVVMGSRGLTGLKHVLLGSVAERTIRTAPCPVLTVKDDDAK